ncbi:hypothetical protein [Nitrospirillum iridis]|uniref:Aminoglycoside phosphotransferase domain-containing protein n=1 Tax=Nitrospirillum iridis TaxID=765888 RepID=A0A7X0B016_9PROT|nr:hypothetical protein [Nitrospirillum iridis]MBB6253308.1 hypothetical protein [Nitrospirillum iridis]
MSEGPATTALGCEAERHWVRGDRTGLAIPAHPEALLVAGDGFLTGAFQAAGALAADNRVTQIAAVEDCPGGSTGRKLFLRLTYEKPAAGLPTDLFVKFSRDFDDPIRDRAKDQLAPEVRFAELSRHPAFPIAVPRTLFGDYEAASGTGLLITERVAFGVGGIERHHEKCLDYLMPDPLAHYSAIVTALGRLAGAGQAGALADEVRALFPYDAEGAAARDPIRYDAARLQGRVGRLADFVRDYPRLLPERLRAPVFLARLADDMPEAVARAGAVKRFLAGDTAFVSLCHWNGNVDNAWFWRDAAGHLRCGLMDWGRVGQMHVALALWGTLSAAEPDLLANHLDALLGLFLAELAAAGGGAHAVERLRERLFLYVATMGLAWLMDAPALIRRELPALDPAWDRYAACFSGNEVARTQLHMLTNFLTLWERHDFGRLLAGFPASVA